MSDVALACLHRIEQYDNELSVSSNPNTAEHILANDLSAITKLSDFVAHEPADCHLSWLLNCQSEALMAVSSGDLLLIQHHAPFRTDNRTATMTGTRTTNNSNEDALNDCNDSFDANNDKEEQLFTWLHVRDAAKSAHYPNTAEDVYKDLRRHFPQLFPLASIPQHCKKTAAAALP